MELNCIPVTSLTQESPLSIKLPDNRMHLVLMAAFIAYSRMQIICCYMQYNTIQCNTFFLPNVNVIAQGNFLWFQVGYTSHSRHS